MELQGPMRLRRGGPQDYGSMVPVLDGTVRSAVVRSGPSAAGGGQWSVDTTEVDCALRLMSRPQAISRTGPVPPEVFIRIVTR